MLVAQAVDCESHGLSGLLPREGGVRIASDVRQLGQRCRYARLVYKAGAGRTGCPPSLAGDVPCDAEEPGPEARPTSYDPRDR
jgi:hypothetical protein